MESDKMNSDPRSVTYCVIWGNNNCLLHWVVVRMNWNPCTVFWQYLAHISHLVIIHINSNYLKKQQWSLLEWSLLCSSCLQYIISNLRGLDNSIPFYKWEKKRDTEINQLTKIAPMVNDEAEFGPYLTHFVLFFKIYPAISKIPWCTSDASVRLSFLLFQRMAHKLYYIKKSSNNVPFAEWTLRDITKELNKIILCKIKLVQVSKQKDKNNSFLP